MNEIAALLIAASAYILFALGLIHLVYTFRSDKFHPRDETLMARMQEVSPVITRETTMWRAWVGFNASHSYGAILFGLTYGYIAIANPEFLMQSRFLLLLGLILLAGYVFLGKRYWFTTPSRGILLAAMLYLAALILVWG